MGSIRSIHIVVFIILGAKAAVDDGNTDRKISTATSKSRTAFSNECARNCTVGESPKICYYKFTVEKYATMGRACELCSGNSPSRLTNDCQCITFDGYESSSIITVNRMYPGPAIIVCQNDFIVVDVLNQMAAKSTSIHWHGIFQRNYQYYDGVPHVTQCPIEEGSTFRYQFKAANGGTHFWHSHSGLQKADGLIGSLIVREPQSIEPNGQLWDFDRSDHAIFITDEIHDSVESHFPGTYARNPGQAPDNILINGMGQWTDPEFGTTTTTPLAVFNVKAGFRYRFRMINGCSLVCPVQMTIEGHSLKVIATDGNHVTPVDVTSITSFSAERYDFILTADKTPGNYWMQFRGLGECAGRQLQQFSILRYESAPTVVSGAKPTYARGLNAGIVLNQINFRCNGQSNAWNVVCVNQLESFKNVPAQILKKNADIRFYMPFGFHTYDLSDIYKPRTYKKFMVNTGPLSALLGNITNKFPATSMISQRQEIPEDQICSSDDKDTKCKGSNPCSCIHIERVPLNSVVEVVLLDEGPFTSKVKVPVSKDVAVAGQSVRQRLTYNFLFMSGDWDCSLRCATTARIPGLSHPFHLHGHPFYIMGEGWAEDYNITGFDTRKAIALDNQGMIKRNLKRPLAKDTYAVPNNGYSIIRFLANNPGYWLFHCHFLVHLTAGMALVFHVGKDSDLPPVPKGFPKCGNFLPPIDDSN